MKRDFSKQFALWLRLVRTGRFDGRPLKRDWPGYTSPLPRYELDSIPNPYLGAKFYAEAK
jgi:hypothetical protein